MSGATAGGCPGAEPRAAWRRPAALAVAGALTMFLVQPPADLWALAWLAPLPWLLLVSEPPRWRLLWAAGFLHWLLAIHWLRLPHPATSIGWVALAAYLGCYLPLFIWAARRLVYRGRWWLVPAAGVAWMACEQLRGWVLGGFTFAGLGHTQWRWTALIQLADTAGAVGVCGVVMAGAAGMAAWLWPGLGWRRRVGESLVAAGIVAAAWAYGEWRLAGRPQQAERSLGVLLVQGSIDTELKHDPAAVGDVIRHYDDLTLAGLAAWPAGGRPDLVVWPETMWRAGLLEFAPDEPLDEAVVAQLLGPEPAGLGGAERAARTARCRTLLEQERRDALAAYARRYGTTWLVGLDRQVVASGAPQGARHYNAALFLDAAGTPLACYDKMHPVMFGEYVPLADRFPFLQRLTPLPAGLTAGAAPVCVDVAGCRVAPTICYETALPDAMRGLVRALDRRGRRPDVIVNLTNDGWFWGSSELDMHLTAAIFRAVEVRTPIVIAANTGFSAAIDGCGRLLDRGPRRATATLRAVVHPDGRRSPWLAGGAVAGWACVAAVLAVAAGGVCGSGRDCRRAPAPAAGDRTVRTVEP